MKQQLKSLEDSTELRALTEEKIRVIIENLLKELVTYPEDILVELTRGDKTTVYRVNCLQRNIGQILGTKGRNIQSLRNLVTAAAAAKGFRAIVEIPYFP